MGVYVTGPEERNGNPNTLASREGTQEMTEESLERLTGDFSGHSKVVMAEPEKGFYHRLQLGQAMKVTDLVHILQRGR